MNAIIRYLDGVRFECESRGHKVISDQPLENGGDDAGMTPPELLLGSLGACAAFYAAQYLRIHKLPVEGLVVRVAAEKAAQPARIGKFRIDVDSPEAAKPGVSEGLLRAAKKCLIHNTLMIAPVVDVVVNAPEPVAAA